MRPVLGGKVVQREQFVAILTQALVSSRILRIVLFSERIESFLKVNGYVASAAGFNAQPKVLDAASDLLVSLFGKKGIRCYCYGVCYTACIRAKGYY